jgi:hypothetical protein
MLDDADHWSIIKLVWKASFQKGYFSKEKNNVTLGLSVVLHVTRKMQ